MGKVLILYGKYGGGHLSAAKSIYEHLENENVHQVEMLDCIEYISKYINIVTTKAYTGMAKKAPWAWKRLYFRSEQGTLARVTKNSNKLMARKLQKYLTEYSPDYIISTHPFSSSMCGYLKKKKKLTCKIATVLTDYAPHNQWLNYSDYIDMIFVAHEGMKKELINMKIPSSKINITGIPISKKFSKKYDKNKILSEFNFSPEHKTALFFAGGEFGLGKQRTIEIFDSLVSEFKDIQVIAVCGKNKKMQSEFDNIVKEYDAHKMVKVIPFTDKVPELMSISDFIISKPGGLTTTEAIAMQLPILAINPLPGQEDQNAEFIVKNKIGALLHKNEDIYISLKNFITNDLILNKMRKHAIKLAKPNSTTNICNIFIN